MKAILIVSLSVLCVGCGDDSSAESDANVDASIGRQDAAGSDGALDDSETAPDSMSGDAGDNDVGDNDAGRPSSDGPPVLYDFHIRASETARIYFRSNRTIRDGDVTGFFVGDVTLAELSIETDATEGHFFRTAEPFTFWSNHTIRYEGGSALTDGDGTALSDFTLRYIRNEIPEPETTGSTYFVSTDGDDSNDGLSEEGAWRTLAHALGGDSSAGPGDLVNVQAGNYGTEFIELERSKGTPESPLKVVGYRETPGDIDALYFRYEIGAELDPAEMPLFDGGDRIGGIFLNIPSGTQGFVFRNLQARNYRQGVRGCCSETGNMLFERLIMKDLGSADEHGDAFEFTNAFFSANYHRYVECVAINATHNNYKVHGDHNFYDRVQSYSDEVDDGDGVDNISTDYYLEAQGHHNIVRGCLAEKRGNMGHKGHSFTLRNEATHNLFENNVTINTHWNFNPRSPECDFNVFRGNEAHANAGYKSRSTLGIFVGPGHGNIWENMLIHDVHHAFSMGSGTGGQFRNIVIYNVEDVFYGRGGSGRTFENNRFQHLSVYNVDNLAFLYTPGSDSISISGNRVENSTFSDVRALEAEGSNFSSWNGFEIAQSNFHECWGAADGDGNITVDPSFVAAESADFHLNAASPLIDRGNELDDVPFDYQGGSRTVDDGPDIGAYEYAE